jgi:hypothetical protein
MEFVSPAQKATYEKIKPWIQDLFGVFAYERTDYPVFGVAIGSAYSTTGVHAWGQDEATICTRAYVVTDLERTPDLMEYLLLQNGLMRFGAFGMDENGDIFFEHSILGSACDRDELKASIMAVISVADSTDDAIMSRWGGRRAVDRSD